MPDRYLRGAILDSERFNTLVLDAQNLYYRLISVVDDFGCYDGRGPVIATAAFRYGRSEALPLVELQRNELLVRYTNAGKPYIALLQWGEIKRGMRRFPAPPVNNDRAEVHYIGVWGRPVDWFNPPRTDLVSVLLGLDGKPVHPQPPEWRRSKDWAPFGAPPGEIRKHSGISSPDAPSPETPSPERSGPTLHRSRGSIPPKSQRNIGPETSGPELSISSQQSTINNNAAAGVGDQQSIGPELSGPEHPSPATAAAIQSQGNGKVGLTDAGEWLGVDEAQRLRWQDMFDTLSIPDTLRDAAVWLLAHPEERRVYTERGELVQYLSRWLIREARPDRTVHARASADSQGKT